MLADLSASGSGTAPSLKRCTSVSATRGAAPSAAVAPEKARASLMAWPMSLVVSSTRSSSMARRSLSFSGVGYGPIAKDMHIGVGDERSRAFGRGGSREGKGQLDGLADVHLF